MSHDNESDAPEMVKLVGQYGKTIEVPSVIEFGTSANITAVEPGAVTLTVAAIGTNREALIALSDIMHAGLSVTVEIKPR